MRLIDADALPYDDFLNGTRMVMQSDIDNAPTIDAVKVVRCKDCKHKSICSKSVRYTIEETGVVTIGTKSIDFCSYGERRSE